MDDSQSSQPATFEDLGIPSSERENSQPVNTVLGQRRKWNSLTKLEVAFLIIAILSIMSALGLTVERLVDIVSDSDANSVDFTFAIVLLINTGFCLFYIVNGVFGERAFELLVFIAGVLTLLIYCILNFTQTTKSTDQTSWIIKLVRLILVGIFGPVDIVLGLLIAKQYYQSGNLIFRTVGANLVLQRLYRNMNLCESLLKFDLQLQITLVVLILKDGKSLETLEILVLSIGIPFSIIYALLGWLALRIESKVCSIIFLLASLAEPAYIIYKIVNVSKNWSEEDLLIQMTIIVASWAGLGVRILLSVAFFRSFKNFGKGLKDKVYGEKQNPRRAVPRETSSYQTLE
ncbi:uncharacterized protein [Apostichopus japonicus]|uniref:uncharacterized protein n=1 Tax=Stichopus japonicus TaxID=307972 RepID=UPI003AB64196